MQCCCICDVCRLRGLLVQVHDDLAEHGHGQVFGAWAQEIVQIIRMLN